MYKYIHLYIFIYFYINIYIFIYQYLFIYSLICVFYVFILIYSKCTNLEMNCAALGISCKAVHFATYFLFYVLL